MIDYHNCCVACGEIIPEGRQVCSQCERKYDVEDSGTNNIRKEYNTFVSWIKKYFV